MKILLLELSDVGHPLDLMPLLHNELTATVLNVDTITPFPELFFDLEDSSNYRISKKNYTGKPSSFEDRILEVVKIISVNNLKYDLIFVLTLDILLSLNIETLELFRNCLKSTPLTGIHYSSSYWRMPEKHLWCEYREKKFIYLGVNYVFTPDPLIPLILQRNISKIKYFWFPDFTSTETDQSAGKLLNRIISKKRGRKVFSLLGSMGKWKGIIQLTEILKKTPDLMEQYLFIISGEIVKSTFKNEELLTLESNLKILEGGCILNLQNISSSLGFNSIVENSDYLLCLYENPQSSGLLSKAALFNKKIIGYNRHYIGDLLKIAPSLGYSITNFSSHTFDRGFSSSESLSNIDLAESIKFTFDIKNIIDEIIRYFYIITGDRLGVYFTECNKGNFHMNKIMEKLKEVYLK